ncbi:uncharacterized protein LOC113274577 [Papaver somniferum]|uniref:uncharacterized protein LOC113274577 n=1 Tax=Papaver somniferum TaxID=3469 RepID=UPI000E703AA4|nr:uncharacterized protein LOC113274577 [Papaver somniferum]
MGTHSKSSKTARSKLNSIKYTCVPLKISSFDISNIGLEQNVNESMPDSEPKSTREILSTAEFVSAVGGLWNCANRGLSVLQPKGIGRYSDSSGVNVKESVVLYSDGGERNDKEIANTSTTGRGNVYVDSTVCAAGCSSSSKFEFVSVVQKISMYESCCGNDRDSLFRRCIQRDSSELNKLASVTIPFDFGSVYRWMNGSAVADLKNMDTLSPIGAAVRFEGKSALLDNLTMKSVVSDSSLMECQDMLPRESINLAENGVPVSSLCSEYFLRPVMGLEAKSVISRASNSALRSDCYVDDLVLEDNENEECKRISDNESCKGHITELHLENEPTPELCSGMKNQLNDTLAKQRHAFAGALAGTFVSVCLHPVDTIKTVIQAHSTVQKPISGIVGSIISDRGVSGLYRGIASNVASSAPISAVYTFTYESVKAYLLPRLPQEYRSVAHCTAGGCASVATSFIFTPSERIKQQMQVSSQYPNCWTALVSILKHGGFPSLYAGWGAILCRNIPHSVIKFYTYESLKQLFLSSTQSTHPNTFQTLICGGLAGSTAALFTTPFDVVKTRLQTEIPGSLRKYDGVFHALSQIAKDEGLKGLYRGLTPRLIMYVMQGALFFASYECLKAAFCLEVPKVLSPTIQNNRSTEKQSTTSPVLLSKQQTIQAS